MLEWTAKTLTTRMAVVARDLRVERRILVCVVKQESDEDYWLACMALLAAQWTMLLTGAPPFAPLLLPNLSPCLDCPASSVGALTSLRLLENLPPLRQAAPHLLHSSARCVIGVTSNRDHGY